LSDRVRVRVSASFQIFSREGGSNSADLPWGGPQLPYSATQGKGAVKGRCEREGVKIEETDAAERRPRPVSLRRVLVTAGPRPVACLSRTGFIGLLKNRVAKSSNKMAEIFITLRVTGCKISKVKRSCRHVTMTRLMLAYTTLDI